MDTSSQVPHTLGRRNIFAIPFYEPFQCDAPIQVYIMFYLNLKPSAFWFTCIQCNYIATRCFQLTFDCSLWNSVCTAFSIIKRKPTEWTISKISPFWHGNIICTNRYHKDGSRLAWRRQTNRCINHFVLDSISWGFYSLPASGYFNLINYYYPYIWPKFKLNILVQLRQLWCEINLFCLVKKSCFVDK
jgi:hypothetical protein